MLLKSLQYFYNYSPINFDFTIKNSSFEKLQGFSSAANTGNFDNYERNAYFDIDSSSLSQINFYYQGVNQNQDYFITIKNSNTNGVYGFNTNYLDGIQNIIAENTVFTNVIFSKAMISIQLHICQLHTEYYEWWHTIKLYYFSC